MANNIPLVVRVQSARLATLRSLARRIAAQRDSKFSLSDLVREALDRNYPEPPTSDASDKDPVDVAAPMPSIPRRD